MSEGTIGNEGGPVAPEDQRARIRKQAADELDRLCDRIGAEAQTRGLTEEILNQILNEEPTAEEVAQSQANLKELRAFVAENRALAEQRGLTEADVPRLISETREERPGRFETNVSAALGRQT